MRFRGEVDIFFPSNVIGFLIEIDVTPRRKRHFLVAAAGTKEELVANPFLVIHCGEHLFEFFVGIRNGDFLLHNGHFIARYSGSDPILFQQKEDNVEARVDGFASITFCLHGFRGGGFEPPVPVLASTTV